MGLKKQTNESDYKESTYPKDHDLFQHYTEKYCSDSKPITATKRAQTKAQKLATAANSDEQEKILKLSDSMTDQDEIITMRNNDVRLILPNKPNYLITLSMKPCFDDNWDNYDRNFETVRLYKKASVFIHKIFTHFDPTLKTKPFHEWPFFFGTMEHFDEEGNLVAPHMHILLKHPQDIGELSELAQNLWKSAVDDAGATGVDVKIVTKTNLKERAYYIMKNSHQDGLEHLDCGVDTYKLCQRYGWTQDAISHDKWRLNRDMIHTAMKTRHPILKQGKLASLTKAERKSLRQIMGDIDSENLQTLRTYLANRDLKKPSIDK